MSLHPVRCSHRACIIRFSSGLPFPGTRIPFGGTEIPTQSIFVFLKLQLAMASLQPLAFDEKPIQHVHKCCTSFKHSLESFCAWVTYTRCQGNPWNRLSLYNFIGHKDSPSDGDTIHQLYRLLHLLKWDTGFAMPQ